MQRNETYFEKLNKLGKSATPFLFLIDYEMKKPLVYKLNEIPNGVFYSIPSYSNSKENNGDLREFTFTKIPPTKAAYHKAFLKVQKELQFGNSYLLNLTMPTKLFTDLDFQTIFNRSKALFKLNYKNEFICFSPEIFIEIKDGIISSYPMKGTIDASIENAKEKILDNEKEFAEHATIVDLIRNDLSIVAKQVRVDKFRYIDTIKTNEGELLQVSSKISGRLDDDFHSKIGSIIQKLLPAGSISGAPKRKTLEIIRDAEMEERGYFTGIFGVFDGKNLESGIMIRYIEKRGEKMIFRSGGGITALSNENDEYNELISKVYVPFY